MEDDNHKLRCIDQYVSHENTHTAGECIETIDFPDYFMALSLHNAIDAHDAMTDPRTREFADCYLRPLGITAMLDAGIRIGGKLRGAICIEHINGKRIWSPDEATFASRLADQVSLLLMNQRRQKIESALRKSEENLRITMDSIGDGVIATDAEGVVTGMNPVAQKLTGWPINEAVGQPLAECFRISNVETGQTVPDPSEIVMRTGRIVGLANHTILTARDGTRRQIADSGAPIRNTQGVIVGVVIVFRDVTEQYRLQEQLRQSQKMDSIGQLAGGVAHDFNNMLGGITGAAELLTMKIYDEETLRYVDMIMDASDRAADLTKQLLAFSRKGKITSTPFDMHQIIQKAIALLGRSIDKNIQICCELNAGISTIIGDPSQMQNVIINLSINARDAMPNGGTLTIATSNVEWDQGHCDTSPLDITPGIYIQIDVLDTGVGMSVETRERLFEPFFTTKQVGAGTGLGLAAVYGTVNDHHGSIHVYSELEQGSVFKIYLPVDKGAVVEKLVKPEPITSGVGTILLVDDEAIIRTMGKAMLSDMGYDVILAEDGQFAVEAYTARGKEIDIVIMDIVMPNMGGREAFEQIIAMDPDARVIFTSGFCRDENIAPLLQHGAMGFIQKPYRKIELSTAIAHALGKDE